MLQKIGAEHFCQMLKQNGNLAAGGDGDAHMQVCSPVEELCESCALTQTEGAK